MVNIHVFEVLLIIFFGCALCDEKVEHRKLSIEINPGCSESGLLGPDCDKWTNLTLIHIRSEGKKDCLHFLWSFHGAPSLLIARTTIASNLTVDWDKYLPGNDSSITFTPEPFYTFGWSLYKLWVFIDDVRQDKDVVKLNLVDQSKVSGYDTKNFTWIRDSNPFITPSEIKFTVNSKIYNNKSTGNDSYFRFAVKVRNTDGYSDILPFMLHNGNISQLDIDYQKMMMNYPEKNTNGTRIGFALALAQGKESKLDTMNIQVDKTLDDEHTPGVFEMYSIRTPVLDLVDQAYLQWKPVCYVAKQRDITDSIDVLAYGIHSRTTDPVLHAISNSIVNGYFGGQLNETLIQFANISFGTQGDGFFEKTNHVSWTFLTGYGTPPKDYVSLLVKLVVAIGLGVPALIILLSCLYVFIKRVARPKDDLLLGR